MREFSACILNYKLHNSINNCAKTIKRTIEQDVRVAEEIITTGGARHKS